MTDYETLPKFRLHQKQDSFLLGVIVKQWLEPAYKRPNYGLLCLLVDDCVPMLTTLFESHMRFDGSLGGLRKTFRIQKLKLQENGRWLIELIDYSEEIE